MNRKGFLVRVTEISLATLVQCLDGRLRVAGVGDYPNALNGLQLENDGTVRRIAAAVDASLSTVRRAVENGCDLLLVHHGLFWSGLQPITGNRHRLFAEAIRHNLAVYSAHLPLDTGHAGNSRLLADALLFSESELDPPGWQPFFPAKGTPVGCRTGLRKPVSREELAERLSRALAGGPVRVCPGGPGRVRTVGVITGGAGSEIRGVANEGIDTLITGEGPHWTYALAEEVGANILYGGHYATETFGVRALAKRLGEDFGLPWEFIDLPTGL